MGRVDADGVGIDYEVVGQGQPVVLLHGWPDSGRSWRHQVPALAAAGFQVVVADLRGDGRSGKPEAVAAYSLPVVTGDVLAILADLNIARAHLVGHDWGAALAWQLALIAPGSVDHLVGLSVGHPVTFRRTLQQREKSWYMLLFQFPGIAERWLTGDNWANFRTWARHPDADEVIAELESADSLTPGLDWYRASAPPKSWVQPPPQLPPVQASCPLTAVPPHHPCPDEYLLFELLCDGRYGLNQPASASRVAAAGVEGIGACPQNSRAKVAVGVAVNGQFSLSASMMTADFDSHHPPQPGSAAPTPARQKRAFGTAAKLTKSRHLVR
jgi:pimeloyl-ACP methyl ester carboxylesterase